MTADSSLDRFLGRWCQIPGAGTSEPEPFTSGEYTFTLQPEGLHVATSVVQKRGGPSRFSYLAVPDELGVPSGSREWKTYRLVSPTLLELKLWWELKLHGAARWTLLDGDRARVVWANSEVNPRSPDLVARFQRSPGA